MQNMVSVCALQGAGTPTEHPHQAFGREYILTVGIRGSAGQGAAQLWWAAPALGHG